MRDKPAAKLNWATASLNTVRPFCRLVIHLDNITAMKRSTHSARAQASRDTNGQKLLWIIWISYGGKFLSGADNKGVESSVCTFSLKSSYFFTPLCSFIFILLFDHVEKYITMALFFFNNVLWFHPMQGLFWACITGACAAMQHVFYSSKCQDSLYLFYKTACYFAGWEKTIIYSVK